MHSSDRQHIERSAFFVLFAILTAHTLVETGRDALFLATLPPTWLPWVYGLVAVATLAVRRGVRRGLARFHGTHLLTVMLLLSSAVTLGFWVLTGWQATWILVALYVWPAIFAAIVIIEFWSQTGDAHTTTEAKGVYGLVGAGATAGAIAGAGMAFVISSTVGARHLLLAGAVTLAASGLWLAAHGRAGADRAASPDIAPQSSLAQDFLLVRSHPYLRRVFGLLLLTTVVVTLIDYVFKSIAARTLPAESLGTFFATTSFAWNILAFGVQLLLVGPLVRRAGISGAPALMPAALLVTSLVALAQLGLASVFALKSLDGALRNSLHRTALELLYVPMTASMRTRIKGFVDVVGQRGGQVAGSALILTVLAMGGSDRALVVGVVVLSAMALGAVVQLRKPYLNLFRETLKVEAIETRLAFPQLSIGSLRSIVSALSSEHEHEVMAAMELLTEERHPGLIPALVLFHPSSRVVLRGLDVFVRTNRTDFEWIARRLFRDHPDPAVRAAALRARLPAIGDLDALHAALDDASVDVQATSLVALLSRGQVADPRVTQTLTQSLEGGAAESSAALARAIARQPLPQFGGYLRRLAGHGDEMVRLEVVRAMTALPSPDYLPLLRAMLGERALRGAARTALVAIGAPALAFLRDSLESADLPYEIRLHIPRSISRFPADRAMPILLEQIVRERDTAVQFKVLRGLGRLRADAPDVPLDEAMLNAAVREAVMRALRLLHWSVVLESDTRRSDARAVDSRTMLQALLRDEQGQAVEVGFRLLGIRHPQERFDRIFRGLHGSPAARASSYEIIEHTVAAPLREAIFALVEDEPAEIRLRRGRSVYSPDPMTPAAALVDILDHGSGALCALAAYCAGELGLIELRSRLEEVRNRESSVFRSAIDQAIQLLDVRSAHAR